MTSTGYGPTVLDTVGALLQESHLAALNYLEVTMTRKLEGEPAGLGVQYPAGVGLDYQVLQDSAIYRLTVTIDRPDLSARVMVALQYTMPNTDAFEDADVARVFGEKVAVPAAYPFARAKMFEVTADAGVPPVVLDIVDMTRLSVGGPPGVHA